MTTDNNNETPIADVPAEAKIENAADGEVTDVATAKPPKRKRIIKTVRRRMMFNYFVYATVVLVMLWIALFFGMNGFYGALVRDEVRRVGTSASAAFPKRGDDNSMTVLYRGRLSELARTNSVSIIVFELADDEVVPVIIVDAIGQSLTSDAENAVRVQLFKTIDLDNVLENNEYTGEMNSDYGSFMFYVAKHTVETDGGNKAMYVSVLKSQLAYMNLTWRMLFVFGMCTILALVLALAFSFIAGQYQTKCLTDLTKKAKRVAKGEYDVEFSGFGYYEYDTLATALNNATERLQSSEQLQRDFIANVSHDIRTPITIIRAYAEMIRDLPHDEKKRKKTAETIISEADRLTLLTNDVMSYSRLSSGATEFEFENCDISAMAAAVPGRFDYFKERDGIVFQTDIDKGLIVNCDKKQIEQVLYNFIGNALNYCGDDKTVILKVKNNGGVVRVEVTDHGKGIAPDELDTVWNRYYRTARARRSAVGSGLGLSICDNILKAHNVKYGVLSTVGEGSTFWFELDLVKAK